VDRGRTGAGKAAQHGKQDEACSLFHFLLLLVRRFATSRRWNTWSQPNVEKK
jgi:hypothetical protein